MVYILCDLILRAIENGQVANITIAYANVRKIPVNKYLAQT